MTTQEFIDAQGLTDTQLASVFGCHRTYWTHLRHGKKALGKPTAYRIWQRTGIKLEPFAATAPEDIDAMARIEGWAA